MKRITPLTVLALAAGTFALAGTARAQESTDLPTAIPVWDGVTGSAISIRRPGRVVQAGTQRFRLAHASAIDHARNGPPEITETEPLVDAGSALRAELITQAFDGLNGALLLLGAAAGLPIDPDDPGTGPGSTDLSDLLGTITDTTESNLLEPAPDAIDPDMVDPLEPPSDGLGPDVPDPDVVDPDPLGPDEAATDGPESDVEGNVDPEAGN